MLEIGLANYLDSQGVLTFDETGVSGNTFLNVLPAEPDEAVGIFGQGGPQPSPKFVEQEGDIQFLVRGTRDPRVAENLAESIFNELQGLDHITLSNGTKLISIKAIQSKPIHIDRDDNGRHKFSLNYRVRHEAETKHRVKNY